MMRKGLLLVASLVFAIACGEGILSLWPTSMSHWFPKGMYQNDSNPAIAYRLAPSVTAELRTPHFHFTSTTDEHGFRGPSQVRSTARPIVGLFGDSFAFGQGVNDADTFAAIVQRQLPDVQLINTGVYDYRPSQERLTYQRVSAQWPVETVVIQLYVNDVMDQDAPIPRRVHGGYLNAHPPTNWWGEVKAWLLLHSELAARTTFVYYGVKSGFLPRPAYLDPKFETTRSREIASTERVLSDWFAEVARRNQRLIVLSIPHEWQVTLDRAPQAARWRAEPGGIDQDATQRWLSRFMAGHPQATFIDFLPIFREHAARSKASLYIRYDEHLNERGNALVAEHLIEALRPSPR